MAAIVHITTRAEWENARRRGVYEAPSLHSEGFIHCSTIPQVIDTANAYFRGAEGLVLLWIDEAATSADIRYEPPAGGAARADERFPHLYGPLNLDAVIEVVDLPSDTDGSFQLPGKPG